MAGFRALLNTLRRPTLLQSHRTSRPSTKPPLAVAGNVSIRRCLLTASLVGAAYIGLRNLKALLGSRPSLAPLRTQIGSQQQQRDMAFALGSINSQDQLVQHLRSELRLREPRVRDAFAAVDRRHFMDPQIPDAFAYQDTPMPIGNEQTISAPHMHAACLDLLEPVLKPAAKALDVGSGSGYLTAVMGRLVQPGGQVLGVEKWPDLAARSVEALKASQPELLESGAVRILPGNALGSILEDDDTEYDAIHVGAAAATMPENLINKLAKGGRMIIPVGGQHDYQTLRCVDKSETGEVSAKDLMFVRYVPLTAPQGSES